MGDGDALSSYTNCYPEVSRIIFFVCVVISDLTDLLAGVNASSSTSWMAIMGSEKSPSIRCLDEFIESKATGEWWYTLALAIILF